MAGLGKAAANKRIAILGSADHGLCFWPRNLTEHAHNNFFEIVKSIILCNGRIIRACILYIYLTAVLMGLPRSVLWR